MAAIIQDMKVGDWIALASASLTVIAIIVAFAALIYTHVQFRHIVIEDTDRRLQYELDAVRDALIRADRLTAHRTRLFLTYGGAAPVEFASEVERQLLERLDDNISAHSFYQYIHEEKSQLILFVSGRNLREVAKQYDVLDELDGLGGHLPGEMRLISHAVYLDYAILDDMFNPMLTSS